MLLLLKFKLFKNKDNKFKEFKIFALFCFFISFFIFHVFWFSCHTFFILHPFQQYFSYVGGYIPGHLSWKEPVLDSFPTCQTTKVPPGDRNHPREVTG